MAAINERLNQVEVERAYRIIGVLENTAKTIQTQIVPKLTEAKAKWRRRATWIEGIAFGVIIAALAYASIRLGYWEGFRFAPPWLDTLMSDPMLLGGTLAVAVLAVAYIHFTLRNLAARTVLAGLKRDHSLGARSEWLVNAFKKNIKPWHILWSKQPAGWNRFTRKRLARVLSDANRYVQTLNNRFADPSGAEEEPGREPVPIAERPSADERILKPVKNDKGAAKSAPPAPVRTEEVDEHAALADGLPTDYVVKTLNPGSQR